MAVGIFKKLFLTIILTLSTSVMAGKISTIPYAVGVYISEDGREYFENNLDDLLIRNGVKIINPDVPNQRHETGEKTVEQLLPNNRALTNLIKSSKYYFRRFFSSQSIRLRNTHNFIVTANDIDVSLNWGRVGIDFLNDSESEMSGNKFKINIVLTLNNARVTVEQARVRDEIHEFFESIGADDIDFGFASNSAPLRFIVPIEVSVTRRGNFDFKVSQPETNIPDIKLALDYKRPLLLPTVVISSNGYSSRLRLDEVERMLRRKHSELLEGLKTSAQKYIDENFVEIVEKIANEKANQQFKKYETMEPLGKPENQRVSNMRYKLTPQSLTYKDRNLHFALKADINDPKYGSDLQIDDRQVANWRVQSRTLNKRSFDTAISLNQGFINKLLALSSRRGYYDNIVSSGKKYKTVTRPVFDLSGRLDDPNYDLRPVVKLKIQYNVTGVKALAVKNPIEVSFDLNLHFPVENGKAKIKVAGVDISSVHVERRFARFEWLWPEVLDGARDTLRGMESGLIGMELSEEIPVPTDIFGFPMRITSATSDPNGHIVVFMDYDL